MMKRLRNQRGAALLETAITLPIILLISVGIFEFGRAYQTWQVLTNSAREGARVAIIAGTTDAQVNDAVRSYMKSGKLAAATSAVISVERNVPFNATATGSRITVSYPFNFTVLNPVAQLVSKGTNTGKGTTTMVSSAMMRNE
jgi:Flp pilus assembly protein TadG